MNHLNSMATQEVDNYRSYLEGVWDIRPANTAAPLSKSDLQAIDKWDRRLAEDQSLKPRFYDFIASPKRLGPIHSIKWAEILTSGVWASSVIEATCPHEQLIDLGCNAGYWTGWMATRHSGDVVGVDRCKPAIRLGRSVLSRNSINCKLLSMDFLGGLSSQFGCIVSLQALEIATPAVIKILAQSLEDSGFLILVESGHVSGQDWQDAFSAEELGLVSVGMVGGINGTGDWWTYSGLVFQKGNGSRSTLHQASEMVQAQWGPFSKWANESVFEPIRINTAYYYASLKRPVAVQV